MYAGRRDHQVKIRGFRIELGEIEACLLRHPSVRDAVVLTRQDQQDDARLVAYVVSEPPATEGGNPDLAPQLREALRQALPGYMVPAAFVFLDDFPTTVNGKLDRRALPAPGPSRPRLDAGYVAPRDSTEELLAEILAEALGLERVGIHDSFFELGGHSLIALRLMARARQALGVELPLSALYESPTVAALARAAIELQLEQADEGELAELLARAEGMSDEELAALADEREG